MLTVGSLFSGIGGLELGLEMTGGFRTVWQVECDDYANRVLARHWPDVARFRDVRECHDLPAVDLICGGFPCTDLSLAGRRAGLAGAHSGLWHELARIVGELRPRHVLVENVPGLLSADGGDAFGTVLGALAALGYDAWWDCLPAAAVGAPHRRDRVFVVAHLADAASEPGVGGARRSAGRGEGLASSATALSPHDLADAPGVDVARRGHPSSDTRDAERVATVPRWRVRAVADAQERVERPGLRPRRPRGQRGRRPGDGGGAGDAPDAGCPVLEVGRGPAGERARAAVGGGGWWAVEPDVGRVAHGVPSRVDRLRCLGNAVVPQVAYVIGCWILAAEEDR